MKRLYAVILIGAGLMLFRDALSVAGEQPEKVQTANARYEATSPAVR